MPSIDSEILWDGYPFDFAVSSRLITTDQTVTVRWLLFNKLICESRNSAPTEYFC